MKALSRKCTAFLLSLTLLLTLAPTALASGAAPGMRVLDCCAAPGGKSFAAAMQMENTGSILSCDLHPHKIALIEKNAARLGISILKAETRSAAEFDPALENGFDLVIADVPCSGLGVIRKKPDIRYKPLDAIVIMLGTNDVKERFGANAACIGAGMERLIQKCKTVDCWGGKEPNILVVAPPRIKEGFHDEVMGDGCVERSRGVAAQFKMIAERNNVHFFDAEGCEFNQIDFMHLTRKGHAQLAEKLAELVPTIL